MPEIKVRIVWDKPESKNWILPKDIKFALNRIFKFTNFKVSKLSDEEIIKEK